jgi:hypothetical protein
MAFTWEYPIFLVRCGGGFAAVEIDSDAAGRQYAVTAFTTEARYEAFVRSIDMEAAPVRLHNDREFAALVTSLSPPFTAIVFDAAPAGDQVNADWQVDITDLLARHLPLARSPWDYPLFVLREAAGYTSICGSEGDRGELHAVGLFTRRELADRFAQAAGLEATVDTVSSPQKLANLLAVLPASVSAAAFNPAVEGEHPTAKHCLRISDIREKYLPQDPRAD